MSDQHRTPEPADGPADGFSCELKDREFAIAITRVAAAVTQLADEAHERLPRVGASRVATTASAQG